MVNRLVLACALAIFAFGAAGVALAASVPTQVKACFNSSGSLRLVASGGCGSNSTVYLPTTKNPGLARAYAHVLGGELDTARSWNVTSANFYRKGDGQYCFRNLSFKPKHAQVTLDYWGASNGQIPVASVTTSIGNYTNCGLATAPQLFVFIGLIDPGVFTEGADFGFYIVMY